MLDFSLSEEHRILRRTVRRFVAEEVEPVASEFEDEEIVKGVIQRAGEAGILGLPIPGRHGGSGASGIEGSIVLEELAAGDGGLATAIGASWLAMTPILIAGTEEQHERFLPPLNSGLACMAMTEPAGGSDIENPLMELKTVRTIAKEDGNGYILNGTKIWPSNSGNAELYVILATVEPPGGVAGSAFFVVPKEADGLSFGQPIPKMGMEADRNTEIFFDDVRVPKENVIGEIGEGAKILEQTVMYNRPGAGAIAVGIARDAYEKALKYAKERVIEGIPLAEHELIQAKFAQMAMKIDAARLLVQRAVWANATGKGTLSWANMAKVSSS
ncbi:TPA: acyl-CoA dehydrogenase [Candidatus Poribacteria bacterium]|nr:acyl-CoA dehydrogenase [Candidatus Poribacteria bacterium]